MADIEILNKGEVYIKVNCEASIAQELNEHFSFEVPNARFHPLVRNKVWDGRVRLYSVFTKEIYAGLLKYVEHFADVNQYTVSLDNYHKTADKVTYKQVEEFCKGLRLTAGGKPIEIRDYQIDAIYQGISNGRQLLLSPTGSGKSLIIYCILRWHQQYDRKQIIIVPTTSLVEQMYSDFQDYSQENGWKASYNCHRIYSGSAKANDMPIVITTWQSVYNLPKKFFEVFQVVFGDEVHLFKAKSLTKLLEKHVKTPYRIGTTGTLDGSKTHKLVLEGLFGPVYKVTTTKQLMDSDQLAELKITALVLNYPDSIKKQNSKLKYQEEMDFLVQFEPRNKFIRNLTINLSGNTLVLFQFVEKHGRILVDMIKDKAVDKKVYFVYGGTDTEAREAIRELAEKNNDAIIVASYGTFSTGINIKNLHNIIFASPSKSRIRNLQSIGRGLRKGNNKDACKLFDIGDDMTWKTKKNYTLQHMVERIKIYNDEGFDYKLIKVDINAV